MHVLELIQTHRMKSGLAISPNTPASSITDEMGNKADLLLVMTVHPGRGGQKFMPECLKKVEELRQRFPGKNIQVDEQDRMFWLRVLPFSDQMTPNRLLRICGRKSMVLLRKLPRERARRVHNHRVSGQHL
jgi:hypothetical protein